MLLNYLLKQILLYPSIYGNTDEIRQILSHIHVREAQNLPIKGFISP